MSLEAHKVPSPVTHILTEATAAARRKGRTRPWRPTFLTDEGAPRPLPINPYSTTTQPAAVSIAPRPPNGPARAVNMHARGRRSQRTSNRLDPSLGCCRAKNIAKRSASYAHANPRLNKETSAIMVSSRTLASNPCPPLCRGLRLALS
jgi:hypothetical protein